MDEGNIIDALHLATICDNTAMPEEDKEAR